MGCTARQLKSRIERSLKERWNGRPRYPTGQPAVYGPPPQADRTAYRMGV